MAIAFDVEMFGVWNFALMDTFDISNKNISMKIS